MGRASRVKGRRGEQEIASRLRNSFPEIAPQIARGWQSRVGCDDPDVCGLPGIWLESKTGKKPNIRAAYDQAKRDAKGRAMPVAIVQDDYARDRLVTLNLTDFIRILRSAYGYSDPLRFGVQQDLFGEEGAAE